MASDNEFSHVSPRERTNTSYSGQTWIEIQAQSSLPSSSSAFLKVTSIENLNILSLPLQQHYLSSVLSFVAVIEGRKSGDRAPGEYGFNPLNFGKTPATAKDLAVKEIRNGRLAMWAAIGILVQGATTGAGALENLSS